jgi:hypothetical protein
MQPEGFEARDTVAMFVDCSGRSQSCLYLFRPVSSPEPPRSKPG